jgi:hypothetical protein
MGSGNSAAISSMLQTWSDTPASTAGVQRIVSWTLAGMFVYTPSAAAILPIGTDVLRVTLSPTEMQDYQSASAQVLLSVTKMK